jgi:hypothetical protein
MAFEGAQMKLTGVTASADLSTKQYYFVKMSGEKTVTVCAGATDKPIGVLQNAPTSGQAAEVCVVGQTKISGDADLNYGDLIGTSGDGQADAKTAGTDTTEYICGQVIQGNGAAGGLVTAFVNCANIGRGA